MFTLEQIATLLVFLPLIGAAITGLNTKIIGDKFSQILTCGSLIVSAVVAWYIFYSVAIMGNEIHVKLLEWLEVGNFSASWSIFVDPLTALMFVVVTTVSALVHIYSVGYMSHDKFKPRFMCYLSLFTFNMLMLVSADNFIQLFFGWEGVGLCSYLLIGFWYKKASANSAAMKAFLVNRVGDFGFALGIFLLFWTIGSVEYKSVFEIAAAYEDEYTKILGFNVNVITLICLLLFMGAMGKSAQIGLHTWLPDAMEGPTPVSALIHAATMVTAGVFMVARCSPLFELSETALSVVTMVGAITALFAASIALVQNDIKRIIAYSTCSQLGYMFFACGVSAYSAGIFHLMTHAFFKALLFLGAGSVIHAMSDEQDIRKMGGIWKKIPYTYAMMWIGSLALAGIYPFAGHFSKDIILEAAYASNTAVGCFAYFIGIAAALCTAFYSWRLLILTFHGKPRASKEVMRNVHESPISMTLPLMILALGAVFSGIVGVKLGIVDDIGSFWKGAIFVGDNHTALEHAHNVPNWVKLLPFLAAIIGIFAAYVLYVMKPDLPDIIFKYAKKSYNVLSNKWYFDELYDFIFVRFCKRLGLIFWRKIDSVFIDGIPNGFAYLTAALARFMSALQSGYIYHYAFVMLFGLLCILSWALLLMK